MQAEISFVLPIYNGLELTKVCLSTLEKYTTLASHEVIIVNDDSTDGTAEFLATLRSPYRVIHNDQRLSYATCTNRGIALARGEFLCLLNNDLVFTPGWLEPMLRAFDELANVGVVGNVQIDPRTGRYDHMGIVFGADGRPHHFGRDASIRPFRGYTEWRAVTAGCCLIKKSVFHAAGGFDEEYKNGCEDVELCLKLGRKGYKHYVANNSVVSHYVSSSEVRHLFTVQNDERLMQRWRTHIQQSLTPRDHRLFAFNYILRFLTRPWHYNGPKLCDSLLALIRGKR